MIDKLQCTNCGNEFIPGKPWSKYCGYSCQQEFHRRKYHQIRHWWEEQQANGFAIVGQDDERGAA